MMSRPSAPGRLLGTVGLAACLTASALNTASAAPRGTLTGTQVHRIVQFTHYRGLLAHRYDVAGTISAPASTVTVVRLDGARLGVPMSELRGDVNRAVDFADRGGSFTSSIKVGRGPKERITYQVSPSATMPGANSRYVIFAPRNEPLDMLTRPERTPTLEALTVIRGREPLTVSLLHDRARGAMSQPAELPYASLCAIVETFNAVDRVSVSPDTLRGLARRHVDLSYLTDPNHPNPSRQRELINLAGRGFEIWSNSMGFAIVASRTGVPYGTYLRRLSRVGFQYYKQNEMHYLRVTPAEYAQLGSG